ncbi:MAG: helix-turn-helix domain-containing protein [Sulfolobales archaeon]
MRSREIEENNRESIDPRLLRIATHLRRIGLDVEIMRYPDERRSVDILIREKTLIKISEEAENISSEEYRDLLASSLMLGTSPLVISDKISGETLVSGIVFEKHSIRIVSEETFIDYFSGKIVSIYEWKGSFYVKINSRALREARERRGMRIGELAEILRVSKKTVYEYERGRIDPDIDHAEKLLELFGEEILDNIDLLSERLYQVDREKILRRLSDKSSHEDPVARRINRAGLTAIKLWRTAPDIIGSYEDNTFTLVKEDKSLSEREVLRKIREAIKFSQYLRCKTYLLVDRFKKEIESRLKERDIEILDMNSLDRDLRSSLRR